MVRMFYNPFNGKSNSIKKPSEHEEKENNIFKFSLLSSEEAALVTTQNKNILTSEDTPIPGSNQY